MPLAQASASLAHVIQTCCRSLTELPVPVLSVISGSLSGAALALALTADWRTATFSARLDFRELRSLFFLDRLLGSLISNARVFLDDFCMDMASAVQCGVVSNTWPDEIRATTQALKLAESVASASPVGVRNTLDLLREPVICDAEIAKTAVKCAMSAIELQLNKDIEHLHPSNPLGNLASLLQRNGGKRTAREHLLEGTLFCSELAGPVALESYDFVNLMHAERDCLKRVPNILRQYSLFDGSFLRVEVADVFGLLKVLRLSLNSAAVTGILIDTANFYSDMLATDRTYLNACVEVSNFISEMECPTVALLTKRPSALAMVVALSADRCVGLTDTVLDFSNQDPGRLLVETLNSASLTGFSALDLHSDSLLLNSDEAFSNGFLSEVRSTLPDAEAHAIRLLKEAVNCRSMKCSHFYRKVNTPNIKELKPLAPVGPVLVDISVTLKDDALFFTIHNLSAAAAKTVMRYLKTADTPVVFEFLESSYSHSRSLSHELAAELTISLRNYSLPIISACETVEGNLLLILTVADINIIRQDVYERAHHELATMQVPPQPPPSLSIFPKFYGCRCRSKDSWTALSVRPQTS